MRGELEQRLTGEMKAGGYDQAAIKRRIADGETRESIQESFQSYIENDFPPAAESAAELLVSNWVNAEKDSSLVFPKVPRHPGDAASIQRGRELYLSDRAKCATCHGPTGRGDGPETLDLAAARSRGCDDVAGRGGGHGGSWSGRTAVWPVHDTDRRRRPRAGRDARILG